MTDDEIWKAIVNPGAPVPPELAERPERPANVLTQDRIDQLANEGSDHDADTQ